MPSEVWMTGPAAPATMSRTLSMSLTQAGSLAKEVG